MDPVLLLIESERFAAAGPADWWPLVMRDKTKPSKRSMRVCMSPGLLLDEELPACFLRLPGAA